MDLPVLRHRLFVVEEGCGAIGAQHVGEAIQLRRFDADQREIAGMNG